MVHAVRVAGAFAGLLAAASCLLMIRASPPPSLAATKPVTPLAEEADALEKDPTPVEDGSAALLDDGSGDDSTPGSFFANNKIRIQDSRIVLTARDRAQLLRHIAQALVADHKTHAAAAGSTTPELPVTPTPLVSLSRDAFLYLKPSPTDPVAHAAGTTSAAALPAVRLGWRYPLAVWSTYKTFLTTDGCDVQRVIGDYFYC